MSALSHVRVLDFTRFLAGPYCSSLLADLGADVIKIEHPKGGDEGRYAYEPVNGVPILFAATNRNKRGITLDIKTPDGRAVFLKLLPHVDVLVENFAGGTLERWDLAPADLCRQHPRLIVASLSGFGQTGPWRDRPSYDIITQASSGFMSLTGFPGNPPTRGGVYVPGGGYYGGYGYYDPWGYGGYPGYGGYGYGGSGYYGGYYDPWYGGYPVSPQPTYDTYRDEGSLKLKLKPRDAEVYVDGYFVGLVDDFDGIFQRLHIESGTHRIEVRAPGYEPLAFDVRITPEHTTTYQGELKRIQ